MNETAKLGIIGGSGLYDLEGLEHVRQIRLETPFGPPSDAYVLGRLHGLEVAFLPRHGRGHRFTPSELNYRANIFGFKLLGVERILAVTAVGSLQEHIRPLDLVLPDQFFDRTSQRASTFFGDGLVAHIPFAQPVCPELSALLAEKAKEAGARVHAGGSLICIEGPAFSTKAESRVYRQWGMDIVGMTSLQEAKLAREAEICYAPLAMVTDYDCWHESEGEVSVEMVVRNMEHNTALAKKVIRAAATALPAERDCPCPNALQGAIMTDPAGIPAQTLERLRPIVGRYLKA